MWSGRTASIWEIMKRQEGNIIIIIDSIIAHFDDRQWKRQHVSTSNTPEGILDMHSPLDDASLDDELTTGHGLLADCAGYQRKRVLVETL